MQGHWLHTKIVLCATHALNNNMKKKKKRRGRNTPKKHANRTTQQAEYKVVYQYYSLTLTSYIQFNL